MNQCFYLKTLLFLSCSSKILILSTILIQIRSTQSFQSNTLRLRPLFPRNSCLLYRFRCKTVLKTISKDNCEHSQFRIITSYLKLILKTSQESIDFGKDLQKHKDKIYLLLRTKQLQVLMGLVELQLLDYLLRQP